MPFIKSSIFMTVLMQAIMAVYLAAPLPENLQVTKIKAAHTGMNRCSMKAHLCIAGAMISSEFGLKKKQFKLESKAENHLKSMKTHAEALSSAIGVARNDGRSSNGAKSHKQVNRAIDAGVNKLSDFHAKVEKAKMKQAPLIPGKPKRYNDIVGRL
ncbi:uncharacterized protein FA14DRAFT_158385 [Meira miltonrushii]|uniref:Uncharacterized protein n=1 Tax=Meira miltonrushii TaxID=1280837 RepID=A0A316V1Z8_9BASI|nr:uncharacterized protein FA14DRAFT_158385 [Meira miltonrushii]PWN31566.1 hypothetical protein FA14DRAFT_158385 [Meira miltonrushii]